VSAGISVHSHSDLARHEISAYYIARTPRVRQRGNEWRGPCPIHDGRDDNFAVNADTGLWFCHSRCRRGGSVYDLEMALGYCDFREAASIAASGCAPRASKCV
jgi:DNA primase